MLSNAMKNKPTNKEDTRMGHIQCERLPKSKMASSVCPVCFIYIIPTVSLSILCSRGNNKRRLTAKSLGELKFPSTQQISIQAKLVTGVNFSVERLIQWRYITLDSSNERTEHSETRSKWMVTWATHFDNIVRNKGLREGLSPPWRLVTFMFEIIVHVLPFWKQA